jgi:hypothetical protein
VLTIDINFVDAKFEESKHPRAKGGEFTKGVGNPSTPQSIAKSFEIAAKAEEAHSNRLGGLLDKKPEGHKIKSGKQTWTKQTIGGDIFWTNGKKHLSSRQIVTETGTALIKGGHVSHKDYYG